MLCDEVHTAPLAKTIWDYGCHFLLPREFSFFFLDSQILAVCDTIIFSAPFRHFRPCFRPGVNLVIFLTAPLAKV